jgi:hypothetical protein
MSSIPEYREFINIDTEIVITGKGKAILVTGREGP